MSAHESYLYFMEKAERPEKPILSHKQALEKLDRIIEYLTEQRFEQRRNSDWEDFNTAIWTCRIARREVANGN